MAPVARIFIFLLCVSLSQPLLAAKKKKKKPKREVSSLMEDAPTTRIGFEMGLSESLASVSGSGLSNGIGFGGGIFFTTPLSQRMYVNAAVSYHRVVLGAGITGNGVITESQTTLLSQRQDTVGFRALMGYWWKPVTRAQMGWAVEGGAEYLYGFSAHQKFKSTGTTVSFDPSQFVFLIAGVQGAVTIGETTWLSTAFHATFSLTSQNATLFGGRLVLALHFEV